MDPAENTTVRFFDDLEGVRAFIRDKQTILFLDYDGTLTPIVDTPDKAVLSDDMRETVRALARAVKVAVVSGRATGDVRGKVGLEGLYYAGSHGFEIVDPRGETTINEDVRGIRPVIDEVYGRLRETLEPVKGALVEHVKYTISTHYRLVSDEDFPRVKDAVEKTLKDYPALRKTEGKKVFEIRPRIDWHKGKAVEWILARLAPGGASGYVPVYIGDDTTDEDAFRFIKDKGFGILVAEKPRPTAARYIIRDTPEVKKTLEFFTREKRPR